jgi:hypothetical protein
MNENVKELNECAIVLKHIWHQELCSGKKLLLTKANNQNVFHWAKADKRDHLGEFHIFYESVIRFYNARKHFRAWRTQREQFRDDFLQLTGYI